MYTVKVERRAAKELARLPAADGDRLALAIRSLGDDPRPPGSIKLSSTDRPLYRLRIGKYRVVYEIRDEVLLVLVVRVASRDQVYRRL